MRKFSLIVILFVLALPLCAAGPINLNSLSDSDLEGYVKNPETTPENLAESIYASESPNEVMRKMIESGMKTQLWSALATEKGKDIIKKEEMSQGIEELISKSTIYELKDEKNKQTVAAFIENQFPGVTFAGQGEDVSSITSYGRDESGRVVIRTKINGPYSMGTIFSPEELMQQGDVIINEDGSISIIRKGYEQSNIIISNSDVNVPDGSMVITAHGGKSRIIIEGNPGTEITVEGPFLNVECNGERYGSDGKVKFSLGEDSYTVSSLTRSGVRKGDYTIVYGSIEVPSSAEGKDHYKAIGSESSPTRLTMFDEKGFTGNKETFEFSGTSDIIEFDESMPPKASHVYMGDFVDPCIKQNIANCVSISRNKDGFSYIHSDGSSKVMGKSDNSMIFMNPKQDENLVRNALYHENLVRNALSLQTGIANRKNDLSDEDVAAIVDSFNSAVGDELGPYLRMIVDGKIRETVYALPYDGTMTEEEWLNNFLAPKIESMTNTKFSFNIEPIPSLATTEVVGERITKNDYEFTKPDFSGFDSELTEEQTDAVLTYLTTKGVGEKYPYIGNDGYLYSETNQKINSLPGSDGTPIAVDNIGLGDWVGAAYNGPKAKITEPDGSIRYLSLKDVTKDLSVGEFKSNWEKSFSTTLTTDEAIVLKASIEGNLDSLPAEYDNTKTALKQSAQQKSGIEYEQSLGQGGVDNKQGIDSTITDMETAYMLAKEFIKEVLTPESLTVDTKLELGNYFDKTIFAADMTGSVSRNIEESLKRDIYITFGGDKPTCNDATCLYAYGAGNKISEPTIIKGGELLKIEYSVPITERNLEERENPYEVMRSTMVDYDENKRYAVVTTLNVDSSPFTYPSRTGAADDLYTTNSMIGDDDEAIILVNLGEGKDNKYVVLKDLAILTDLREEYIKERVPGIDYVYDWEKIVRDFGKSDEDLAEYLGRRHLEQQYYHYERMMQENKDILSGSSGNAAAGAVSKV